MSLSVLSTLSSSAAPHRIFTPVPSVSEHYSSFSGHKEIQFCCSPIPTVPFSIPHYNRSHAPVYSRNFTLSSVSNSSTAGSSDGLADDSRLTEDLNLYDIDEDDNLQEAQNESEHCSMPFSDRWDVLGLGQAMVDFSGTVDDEFLNRLGLEKGTRKVVNHEERGRVLQAMDGCSYKAAAGGSLSNTLVALARLGNQGIGGPLNISMAGSVGSDPLGGFYKSKLRRANVSFLSEPIKDGTTGMVIVLTTPDAQRTMLAYQGTSSRISYDPSLANSISRTSILVVEGYLFEFPDTIESTAMACEQAHRCGALVAITASDVSCIERHYDDFWRIILNYSDIIFANSDEARALCHCSPKEGPDVASRYLSHFVPFVSVTDGRKGSFIGLKGEVVYIPPPSCVPVDTCGAGDAYASGILYGLLRGNSNLKGMGTFASKVAATVVSQQGTRLQVRDASRLVETYPLQHESSTRCSDVGSDQISSF